MRLAIPFFVGILLLVPWRSWANEDSHTRAAEALLDVMEKDRLLSEAESWTTSLEEQFGRMRQNTAEKARFEKALDDLRKFYARVLKWDKVKHDLTALYKSTFTESEIEELIRFFNTPIGQKYVHSRFDLNWKEHEINKRILKKHREEHDKLVKAIYGLSDPMPK